MYADGANCNFLIDTLLVSAIYIPPAAQDIATANVFFVKNAMNWEMNTISVVDLESGNTKYESLLYSTALGAKFIFTNSNIMCRTTYSDIKTNPTYSSVLYI